MYTDAEQSIYSQLSRKYYLQCARELKCTVFLHSAITGALQVNTSLGAWLEVGLKSYQKATNQKLNVECSIQWIEQLNRAILLMNKTDECFVATLLVVTYYEAVNNPPEKFKFLIT